MNKENKLGMGLGALLSTSNNKNEKNNGIQKINISQIIPNPSQPRKNFKNEDLKELSSSIKNQGLIQPIIVKPIPDNQFQIVAGERRWRACQLNGMHEVDCVIKDIDDTSVLEAALIENIQREDLNVIEEANAYKGLIDIKRINNESLAKLIGKSSSHVSNILRLLELDKTIQEMVTNGKLTMGHARALIGVPNAVNKAKEIIEKKLSVRQVEKITSEFKKNKTKKTLKDPNIIDLEKELSDKIGL
ncbi:ParB/RepB/Spo0J family partition protein, partial [Pelagibacteraceae bacterium]|nr:ParB/RepB/Spo0J family partition protein [Pelagibacteraceae bacterium]